MITGTVILKMEKMEKTRMKKKAVGGRKKGPATMRSGSAKTKPAARSGEFVPVRNAKRSSSTTVVKTSPMPKAPKDEDSVTLPRADFDALVEAAEDNKSRRAYEATRDEESFPAAVIDAILDGENAVKAWRVYRGLKQNELAEGIGISKSHLSEVESGKANLSVHVLSELANALEVDMEMLVPAAR